MAVTTIKSYNSDNQAEVNSNHELLVSGTVTATNPSVGTNGQPAPTSSTEVGGIDPSGNLQGLKVDSAGALVVTDAFGTQNVRVLYNQANGLAINVETNVNSYTAPAGVTAYLLSITASGQNRGTFNVYNNGVAFDSQWLPPTNLSSIFDYKTGSGTVPGMVVVSGNTILVTAINSGTTTASYSARFLILEVS